jgi:hypothetical protein
MNGYARHWISIGQPPMPTILKPSTASITRTLRWSTHSPASAYAGGATFRSPARSSRTRSALPSSESLAAVDLWITEFVLSYDGKPSYTVSIMEFRGDEVAHETQLLCRPIRAQPSSRSIRGTDRHTVSKRRDSLITTGKAMHTQVSTRIESRAMDALDNGFS